MRYAAASVVTDRQTDRQTDRMTDRQSNYTATLAHAPRVNNSWTTISADFISPDSGGGIT